MNQLLTRTLHERVHARHLAHDNERLREALSLIAIISTAGIEDDPKALVHIARVARNALLGAQPADPALEHTS